MRDMSAKNILIFNAYMGGHHGSYVRMLVENWVTRRRKGNLRLVLPPDFVHDFPDTTDYIYSHQRNGIVLSPYPEKIDFSGQSIFDFIRRDMAQGKMVKQAILDYKPDHCLLMYFDHVQASLWTGLRFDFPITFSGIYFRPSFHYASLGSPSRSATDHARRLQKRILLSGALTNPHLTSVFSLDPFAVPFINRRGKHNKALALPDGITTYRSSAGHDRLRLDIRKTDGRRTALLFGGLNRRKGVMRILEALPLLPKGTQNLLRLVLAGPVEPREREEVHQKLDDARSATTVEIVLDDRYVPNETLQSYIDGADFILVAYQRHIGSSGVLIRAAEAGAPVLGSNFGLVGAQITRNRLGMAVDSTSAEALSRGIELFVDQPESSSLFDPEASRRFAEAHSADAFADTIFANLSRGPSIH